MSNNTVAFIQLLDIQVSECATYKAFINHLASYIIKTFPAVYCSIKTFKITIFLTILNICLDLPLMIHFYGQNKLFGFIVFNF